MQAQNCWMIPDMERNLERPSWLRHWPPTIYRIREPRKSYCRGFGLHGNFAEIVSARNSCIYVAGGRTNPDVNSGGSIAVKSETPCEPELLLLLLAGMNDHLHAAGLLEPLRNKETMPKKIWEAVPTLFSKMVEIQELVAVRLGSRTKEVFTSSPAYACMPLALQFVYAVLVLMAESSGMRILMAAPNGEWEPKNKRRLRSELAANWADISHPERLLPARRQLDSAG